MKESRIILNAVPQISPNDTYDPTTPKLEVTSRRADPYTDVGKEGAGDTAALQGFITGMTSGATHAGTAVHIQNIQDVSEGEAAYEQGLDPNEAAAKSAAFYEGFQKRQGKAEAIRGLYPLMETFHNEHKDDTPEEYSAAYTSMIKKNINGTSKSYALGYAQVAATVGEHLNKEHGAYITKVVNEENYANLNEEVRADVLGVFQEYTGLSITGIMSDYKTRQAYEAKRLDVQSTLPRAIREYVSITLDDCMNMDMSKRDAGIYIAKTLAHISEQYGLPEIIKYAEIPDEDGISVISNPVLQQELTNSIRQATAAHEAILHNLKAKERETDEKAKNILTNDYLMRMVDAETALDWQGIDSDLRKDSTKLLDHFPTLLDKTQRGIRGGAVIGQYTDGAVFRNLMEKGAGLTTGDLIKAMPYLSEQDVKYFHSVIASAQNQNRSLALESNHRTFGSLYSGFNSIYSTDTFGKFDNPTQGSNMQDAFWRSVQEYQHKNGMQYPTGDAFTKIKKEMLDNFPLAFAVKKPEVQATQPKAATAPAAAQSKVAAKFIKNPTTGKIELETPVGGGSWK